MKNIKKILTYILGLMLLVFFVKLNVTYEFPVEDLCHQVIEFKHTNGKYPNAEEFDSMDMPYVGIFSFLQYKKLEDDFHICFCPHILAPRTKCDKKGKVYYEN